MGVRSSTLILLLLMVVGSSLFHVHSLQIANFWGTVRSANCNSRSSSVLFSSTLPTASSTFNTIPKMDKLLSYRETSNLQNSGLSPLSTIQKLRIIGVLEYDGTKYHGFQRQSFDLSTNTTNTAVVENVESRRIKSNPKRNEQNSVQGVLELSINSLFGDIDGRRMTVCAASRTDKGVHSQGQTFHFDLNASSYIQTIATILPNYEDEEPSLVDIINNRTTNLVKLKLNKLLPDDILVSILDTLLVVGNDDSKNDKERGDIPNR